MENFEHNLFKPSHQRMTTSQTQLSVGQRKFRMLLLIKMSLCGSTSPMILVLESMLSQKTPKMTWVCNVCYHDLHAESSGPSILCDCCLKWFHFTHVGLVKQPKATRSCYASYKIVTIKCILLTKGVVITLTAALHSRCCAAQFILLNPCTLPCPQNFISQQISYCACPVPVL